MTIEEATQKAADNNALLTLANINTQDFKVLQSFTGIMRPNFILCVIPVKYDAQYLAADLETKTAFARVYFRVVFASDIGAANAGYVAQYDIEAAQDEVLKNYLDL
jgi:hypothetical protein